MTNYEESLFNAPALSDDELLSTAAYNGSEEMSISRSTGPTTCPLRTTQKNHDCG